LKFNLKIKDINQILNLIKLDIINIKKTKIIDLNIIYFLFNSKNTMFNIIKIIINIDKFLD
jgi:hypothetical protein